MAGYIALLRGINVGKKNRIKMVDLKQLFVNMGFGEVQTYIQSGNVLFKSNEDEEPLRKKIELGFETAFGIEVSVVLRTAEELEWIIQDCPYTKEVVAEADLSSEGESLYVVLLIHAPSQEKIELLDTYTTESDEYRIEGRNVYLLFRHGIRNSRLADNLAKLGVPATVRNWKTINKLGMLAKDI
ncbi:protein of unknown function DUF1697 [Desulfofarcimen acetoxidans DSM 771]|jgi:uncharacterized protein (DUF1697 family)|uniref:Cytoplasmic protein n=1 Tax=Desulfofarcimen acetoxidans (strain ATCC 49208 / DSM 771 / KCTC 5769 / VKM B-1644 / 5575) TaxID=485916 RepID=C8W0V8_DESAS|nr:DUF1697 domain-containing protein [Desulfofarcimen acetoxidans]ACV63363.1 protein of unknown function DUF1697 [Desulfofarcimen acetoxidans DSM 771]